MSHNNRGNIWRNKRDYDRAIADYDAAIRLDPKFAGAIANRGLAYEGKGDFERSAGRFQRSPCAADNRCARPVCAQHCARAARCTQGQRLGENTGCCRASCPEQCRHRLCAASGPSRVALVIGNSAYSTVATLPNARRDADAVAASLKRVGFRTVIQHNDLARDRLIDTLRAFAAEADKADWAVVYFAGHGIEINGTNYLIPVDAKLSVDRDVQFEAVSFDQVMSAVEGAKKLRLVLLDACRDNPFANQMRKTVATRSVGPGACERRTGSWNACGLCRQTRPGRA